VEAFVPISATEIVEQRGGRRVLTAFVRRVQGRRLWLWYLPRAQHVILVLVTKTPPIST
jgi:hypothetical protein